MKTSEIPEQIVEKEKIVLKKRKKISKKVNEDLL